MGKASRVGLGVAAASMSGTLLTSCSRLRGDTVKIGVIAPFSGAGSATGTIVSTSLEAAVKHLNTTGGVEGRKVEVLLRDTGGEAAHALRHYGDFAGQRDLIGVLWCGAPGLDQALPRIRADGMPVVVAFDDPSSGGPLTPGAGAEAASLFKMQVVHDDSMAVLARYAADDRSYASAALLHDAGLPGADLTDQRFREIFTAEGVEVRGVERYSGAVEDGTDATHYVAHLERLRALAPQVLYLHGLPEHAAGIATALASMDASYVDTPTTRGPAWHPHLFGSPLAFGDGSWTALAGEAAKVGTVTTNHVGGLIYLPSYAVGGWMRTHLGREPSGWEELPADALASLLEGMKKAGTTDRRRVVEGIETMGTIKFASAGFGYTRDRHVAFTPDDVVIMTLERLRGAAPSQPPYELGSEWRRGGLFDGTAAAPTHLVRPTVTANRSAHPQKIEEVLAQHFGTHCTVGPGGDLIPACTIH